MNYKSELVCLASFIVVIFHAFIQVRAEDSPQWGERYSRNMVSNETGLPVSFDPATGENIKWSVSLGSNGYALPVISGGKVLIGANNTEPRDPRLEGDRAVLLCLNEADGSLCWQLATPRIGGDQHNDWYMTGMCSPPTVEGDRAYILTNRSEVLCLDMNGQADGNDGVYQGEGWYLVPESEPSIPLTDLDGDILWSYDLRKQVGICPHDSPHASILLDGPYLYVNTCNGVNYKHGETRSLDAPSLIVLDKATGMLVARDGEHFGPRIFHSSWSSPALGEVNGQKQIFFGGPDGICYAFEAVSPPISFVDIQSLKKVWEFDCDPSSPKENIHDYLKNREEGPSLFLGMPVFYKDRVYATVGGDAWWGKEEVWLKCIDATKRGDITQTGEIWSYPLELHSCSTPAIANGLVFVGDSGKNLHCIDAETGKPYWSHELRRETWASALAADGKVYIGSRGGDLWILEASQQKKVLACVQFDDPINSTPVAANGVLYVSTMRRLYAIEESDQQ